MVVGKELLKRLKAEGGWDGRYLKRVFAALATRTAVALRWFRSFLFRGVRFLSRHCTGIRPAEEATGFALLVPGDAGASELGGLLNKAAWYLGRADGDGEGVRLDCYVPQGLRETTPVLPEAQEDYLHLVPEGDRDPRRAFEPSEYAAVLVAEFRDLVNPRLLRSLAQVYLVDEKFYSTVEVAEFGRAAELVVTRAREIDRRSRVNLERLVERTDKDHGALVLGTGPSVTEIYERSCEASSVIVCNSIVKNRELLQHLDPDAICFADPVFHFGPSRYAARFRSDLLGVLEEYDAFAVTRRKGARLLLRHHPELEDRIIGLVPGSTSWKVPGPESLQVRSTANIMTLFMLPLAASLSSKILVGGCDGREQDESYFWKHEASVQYEGLMNTVVETHPSFFRDRIYENYYEQHCERLEEELSWLESNDYEIRNVTHSFIPALRSRTL